MGLVTFVLQLPVAPLRGVIALGELIQQRVEEELHDPASVRRQLEATEEAAASGEISPEEEAEMETEIVARMIGQGGDEGGRR